MVLPPNPVVLGGFFSIVGEDALQDIGMEDGFVKHVCLFSEDW